MDSEDGQVFVKACAIARSCRCLAASCEHMLILVASQNLAYFVRTHERNLANALQLQRQRNKNGQAQSSTTAAASSNITLADALSRPYLSFTAQNVKPAKLTLTPHHLYYLLTKFEDLGVDVGPMNVRLENIHADVAPSNYVSFLGNAPKSRGRQADADSLKSVSSVRSVMSSMSSMWSSFTLSNSAAKQEKQMAQFRDDIKYLYSCFTKIPALRLSPDHRAHLISGFEEFPFDAAVPLFAFKNLGALEICDLDFRSFYGWDRLAEQVRSLTVRRANVDDPLDLLFNIVLDDMDRRRRRSSRAPMPSTPSATGVPWPTASPKAKYAELARSFSTPTSPLVDQRRVSLAGSPQSVSLAKAGTSDGRKTPTTKARQRSTSPTRPVSSRHGSLQRPHRSGTPKLRRSSGSDSSSTHDMSPRHSTTDLLGTSYLPSSKWRFLRHLSLAENGLTDISVASLAPVAGTLQSLDLSGNLLNTVPEALASLTHLRALNLSNCMIERLNTLTQSPLPAITTLNLRSNRLQTLSGIEKLYSLERVDVRDNNIKDPTEIARLTGIPNIIDVYVAKNHFTRTHPNYRVTIFNLFRSTPGHSQDVTIDTQGPTSQEKKQLVDRVPEALGLPIVKPEPEEEHSVPGAVHDSFIPAEDTTPLPPHSPPTYGHRRHQSDLGPRSSQRKKKAPRRRIVELSQAEIQPPPLDLPESEPAPTLSEVAPLPESEPEEPTTPDAAASASAYTTAPTTQTRKAAVAPSRPQLETSFSTPAAVPRIHDPSDDDAGSSVPHSPQDVTDSARGGADTTDLYKQKIESMKTELGPNWLTALNDDRFNEDRSRDRSFSPASRSSTVRPAAAQRGVSVGGRTLG
jgi:hypothetical protein